MRTFSGLPHTCVRRPPRVVSGQVSFYCSCGVLHLLWCKRPPVGVWCSVAAAPEICECFLQQKRCFFCGGEQEAARDLSALHGLSSILAFVPSGVGTEVVGRRGG